MSGADENPIIEPEEVPEELAQIDALGPWIGGALMVVIVVTSALIAFLSGNGH